jgi:hypothetical protein
MRRVNVDMQALSDAMTMPEDVPFQSFLDLRDGRIVEFSSENEDDLEDGPDVDSVPESYVEIPRLASHEQYEIMAGFVAAVDDDELSERLGDALQGRGAFSRFRRIVDSEHGLRERWFAFQGDELIGHARRWLASLGIEPLADPPATAAPAPGHEPAATPPAIGLLDLVLLGASDGKTELLEGQVLRQIRTLNPSEARRLFKQVARELCWHFDRPWRKRYVEGTTTFDIERAHLRVEGEVVELWIDVPRATWKAFG